MNRVSPGVGRCRVGPRPGRLDAELVTAATVAGNHRTRVVGRQPRPMPLAELAAPVLQLALLLAGLQPAALPQGVIGVLDRQGRQAGLRASRIGTVETTEFLRSARSSTSRRTRCDAGSTAAHAAPRPGGSGGPAATAPRTGRTAATTRAAPPRAGGLPARPRAGRCNPRRQLQRALQGACARLSSAPRGNTVRRVS